MKTNLLKNLDPSSNKGAVSVVRTRKFRIAVLATVFAGLVISLTSSRFAQERPAVSGNQRLTGDDAATWAILNPEAAYAQRPKNQQFLQEEAVANFTILNPHLVNQERRKDPAVQEREKMVHFTILKAKEIEAERRKDPEMRRKEEEAFQTLVRPVGRPN